MNCLRCAHLMKLLKELSLVDNPGSCSNYNGMSHDYVVRLGTEQIHDSFGKFCLVLYIDEFMVWMVIE